MKIDKSFFERNSVEVATDLLGHYFITDLDGKRVIGKIVETEAYSGEDDLACHASKGRTKRTELLYGEAGHFYVYLNYGIFYLTNIVCDATDYPSAVLIRSAEIVEGVEFTKQRIKNNKFVKDNGLLATGPGKFSIAFGITRQCNGLDIETSNYTEILYERNRSFDIIKTARIGIDYAGSCKGYPWRFYIKDNPCVSKQIKQ